jgi:hypothetical protein
MSAKWSIPFDEIAKRIGVRADLAVKTIALDVFERVIRRTPVDTGRLKGNWFPSYGSYVAFSPDRPDPSGAETERRMRLSVMSYPVGGTIYLTNSLPYAAVVEYGQYPNPPKAQTGKTSGGFSIQAPQGMVRISVQETMERLRSNFPDLIGGPS